MDQILVYSDSLTWGIIPDTRERLPFNKRWPGVLEAALLQAGKDVRILENCLNGRRTVWSDPLNEGRDGSAGLMQVIEMHSPLKLVVVMLGTNDFQCTHDNNAWLSAQGMAKIIDRIQKARIEPGMPSPQILIIAPPVITQPRGVIANKFNGAERRCVGLAGELKKIADAAGVMYFDSNDVVTSSKVDGIHLDEPDHQTLGQAVAAFVAEACRI